MHKYYDHTYYVEMPTLDMVSTTVYFNATGAPFLILSAEVTNFNHP